MNKISVHFDAGKWKATADLKSIPIPTELIQTPANQTIYVGGIPLIIEKE